MDPRVVGLLVAVLLGGVTALVVTPLAGLVVGGVAVVAMLPLLGRRKEE